MNRVRLLARTLPRLGFTSVARVALYRLGVRTGMNRVRRLNADPPTGPFFRGGKKGVESAGGLTWRAFGWHPVEVRPGRFDWHANVLTGERVNEPERPWWKIPDFGAGGGDIKGVWEASRFAWAVQLAEQGRRGASENVALLNDLVTDWCARNPPYIGPNWKCGQEASIRVLHIAVAAAILGEARTPEKGLLDFVRVHCRRIQPTLLYAVGQDNNHGTSEAAALFVGGSWLATVANDHHGARWLRMGRRWLENRVLRLIGEDGSFSQYSVTYHRLMLDTLSIVEIWRRRLGLPRFSEQFYARVRAATVWLRDFVVRETGGAPNLGANDGAWLLGLPDLEYWDFRPSVQLAAALFCDERAYDTGSSAWSYVDLFALNRPSRPMPEPTSRVLDDGGYAVLRAGSAVAFVRYPRYRFRPSHADALHVDLWVRGINWLRDGGTFSYAATPEWLAYFSGTQGHNTIQFDGTDQMPRLSRFLFGDWLEPTEVGSVCEQGGEVRFTVAYRNRAGHEHRRTVRLSERRLVVVDEVRGFRDEAVLRWRLAPGNWAREGNCVVGRGARLRVLTAAGPVRARLTTGWESRFYLQKTEVPVLEVAVHQPCTLETTFEWV